MLHLIKENIRANPADLTAFESWRFDHPPLSYCGGSERARAAFGNEEELERVLADMNGAVFDAPDFGDAAEPRPYETAALRGRPCRSAPTCAAGQSDTRFQDPQIIIESGRRILAGNVNISPPNVRITDNALYIAGCKNDFVQKYLAESSVSLN